MDLRLDSAPDFFSLQFIVCSLWLHFASDFRFSSSDLNIACHAEERSICILFVSCYLFLLVFLRISRYRLRILPVIARKQTDE